MKAFITGGTGFIGANLVDALNQQGISARVLRRDSSSLVALEGLTYESAVGDILQSPAELAEQMAGCDWVFHVAAVSDYWRQGTEWLYKVNVEGTKNVLAAAQLAGVGRFVFTSSLAAMGLPKFGQQLDESSQFNLEPEQFPYGHSKHLAEIEVRKAVDAGLKAIIVNPSVVLGPRDINEISGSIVLEAARGRLRFFPPGGVNFVDVADVAAGHIAAARQGQPGERYILGGIDLSHKEAVTTICKTIGKPPPKLHIPRWVLPIAALGVSVGRLFLGNKIPMDANQVRMSGATIYADIRKAKEDLNLPQTPFKTTVQQTYDWYNSHGYL
ncbi:MAG: SDR family oxidoreductase [Candidatus Promineifilaceae bacterium]